MQNQNGKLQIHTAMAPESAAMIEPGRIKLNLGIFRGLRKSQTAKSKQKAARQRTEHRADKTDSKRVDAVKRRIRRWPMREGLSASQKLLRNSAVAGALLLTLLAIQNINQPWTRSALGKVRDAVTMRIDLDESLGRLNFVRGLVPDTALVFWNMGGGSKLQVPVEGTVAHEYADMQPWVEFVCAAQRPVVAAQTGTVSAVGQGAKGDWTLMLDHENGEQTVYAYLEQVLVKPGEAVQQGTQLGITADADGSLMYFEFRKDGMPQDPGTRLGS